MTTWVMVGAVTAHSARVSAKTSAADVRLAVDTDSDLSNPSFSDTVSPAAGSVARLAATGLTADTQYYYAVEEDGTLDTTNTGRFRTLPGDAGEPFSFRFGVASCAGLEPLYPGEGAVFDSTRISNHPAHSTMRQQANQDGWAFAAYIGDRHYYNPGQIIGSTVSDYRRSWDDVMLQSHHHRLSREVPMVDMWDDHDFADNNSDRTAAGRLTAQQVYREYFPHYPLPAQPEDDGNQPIYHSTTIGRVLIIVSDTRSSRSPNSDPDDGNKTMLGAQQKAWMESVLSNSDAEFFVWLTPTPWIQGDHGDDNWSNFTTEASEMVDLFRATGYLDRMIAVTGDTHHMGIETGSNNITPGNIPLFVFNPIDSRVNDGSSVDYDIGSVGDADRGQYGVVDVVDAGDAITVTGIGYINGEQWRSHSVTVSAEPPDEDEPDRPAPPSPTPAVVRTRVTWLGCDLITGRIIAELPEITGRVKRVLGSSTSTRLRMPIPMSGPGSLGDVAFQATEPAATMIVAVVNDVPTWAGYVASPPAGSDGMMDLACVSLEGYLDRRYVGDHDWVDVDEARIAAGLADDANVEGINLIIDAPATGRLRTRRYRHTDDATVYKRLRELMGVRDGIEWTIDVDWETKERRSVAKILRVRKRIGIAADSPQAVFDSRGASGATYTYTPDYSSGKGANYIIATSSGEGDDRPESEPHIDIRPGFPRWEERISPSTAIKEVETLNEHAASRLALVSRGSRTWDITTQWNAHPRLNVDWRLGDDVAWDLIGHRHPSGVQGTGRVIGWDLDMSAGTVTPILLDPQEGVV